MEDRAEVGRVEKRSSRRGELDEVEAKRDWAAGQRMELEVFYPSLILNFSAIRYLTYLKAN